jgi:hypothetical protein
MPIEEYVEDFSVGHVTKRKVFGYIGLLWLAMGAAALVAQSFTDDNSPITMFLLIAGISLVIYGVIVFFVKKERYFYDGRPMKMREFLFDKACFDDVMKLYNEQNFSDMLDISRSSASKMKLKVLFATDYSIAFSQIYKFNLYDFEPVEPVRVHDKAHCNSLNTLVITY